MRPLRATTCFATDNANHPSLTTVLGLLNVT